MYNIIGITGHRPHKFDNDYELTSPWMQNIKNKLRALIAHYKPKSGMSGLALGIDQLYAEVIIEANIELICAIPCRGQENAWPKSSRDKYNKILSYPKSVHYYLADKYTPTCMQERNIWMCDRIDLLIDVWDGSPGGTRNCIEYADKIGLKREHIEPADYK